MVYLMYHELERAGRPLCESARGYARYAVPEEMFRAQIEHLRARGLRGASVSEALYGAGDEEHLVGITFDDGCETDLVAAALALRDAGFGATFYVTTGWLGRRGHLARAQLRELSDEPGFEIGAHGESHRYLTDLGERELADELAGPKARLEDITGRQVLHASCPGGRWSRRVAAAAARAGFLSLATSRAGTNGPGADPMRLARVRVLRDTTLAEFERLRDPRALAVRHARELTLDGAKLLLGNPTYERLRALVFGDR